MEIKRTAEAVWTGDFRHGSGRLTSGSGVLKDTPYGFRIHSRDALSTNPEELLAAAHASCYSMAFALILSGRGYQPERIEARVTCVLTRQTGGGFRINKMHLEVRGNASGIDEATFRQIAQEAEKACPVSNALRGGVEIELEAALA